MSTSRPVVSRHSAEQHTSRPYIVGYLLSLIVTLTAYILVSQHRANKSALVGLVAGLALTQFLVQMFYFLHLGRETKPRWKLLVFGFMVVVVLIIVFGSLWIMSNLNYHMTSQQINIYLNQQGGI